MSRRVNEVIGVLSQKSQQKLSQKSAESLRQMLGGKSFMQASMDAMQLLPQIEAAEAPYRRQLEDIAVQVCYDAFPILQESGIKIQPSIGGDMSMSQGGGDEADEEDLDDLIDNDLAIKRRIINSITQGAALRGTKAYYLFDYVLDFLDDIGLKDKYEKIIADSYGIYDDDSAISMMMAMLAAGAQGANQGGESEVKWDDNSEEMTVKATAKIFPILIQEIIKGLYEFVATFGWSEDPDMNQKVMKKVDKVSNEPEDLRYGKFIYDALNNLYVESGVDNPRVRELFFREVYKLPTTDFKKFIENVINDELAPDQVRWVDRTIRKLNDGELNENPEVAPAPVKPVTKPGTKPGRAPSPLRPPQHAPNPAPKAQEKKVLDDILKRFISLNERKNRR